MHGTFAELCKAAEAEQPDRAGAAAAAPAIISRNGSMLLPCWTMGGGGAAAAAAVTTATTTAGGGAAEEEQPPPCSASDDFGIAVAAGDEDEDWEEDEEVDDDGDDEQQQGGKRRQPPLVVAIPRLNLDAVVKPPANSTSSSGGNSSNGAGGGGRHALFGKNLPESQSATASTDERTRREEAALCLLASPAAWRPVHRAAPQHDRKSYVYRPPTRQDTEAHERMLQRVAAPGSPAHGVIQALWAQLRACRRDCEAMAARGVRVARDVSRDWQETASGLIDRVVQQDADLARVRSERAAAEAGRVAAESALQEAKEAQARAEAQVQQLTFLVGGAAVGAPPAAGAAAAPPSGPVCAAQLLVQQTQQQQDGCSSLSAAGEPHALKMLRLMRQRDRHARDAADALESAREAREALGAARGEAQAWKDAYERLRVRASAVAEDGAALLRRNERLEDALLLARGRRAGAAGSSLAHLEVRVSMGGEEQDDMTDQATTPAGTPPPPPLPSAAPQQLQQAGCGIPRSSSQLRLAGLGRKSGLRGSCSSLTITLPHAAHHAAQAASSPSSPLGKQAVAVAAAAQGVGDGGGCDDDVPSAPDSPAVVDADACRRRLQQLQAALHPY